jgi:hypothetical protein
MNVLAQALPEQLNHQLFFRRLFWDQSRGKIRFSSFDPHELERAPVKSRSTATNQAGPNKFVSLALFTANLTGGEASVPHIYLMGCLQNAALKHHVYQDWYMIIYVDATSWAVYPELYALYFNQILKNFPDVWVVEVDWRTALPKASVQKLEKALGAQRLKVCFHESRGWDLARIAAVAGVRDNIKLQFPKTLWRFLPGGYNVVFVSRDADARINLREETATQEWLHSTYTFSRMFDNPGHANPFLAGMWGAKAACHNLLQHTTASRYGVCRRGDVPLPDVERLTLTFLRERDKILQGYGIDELFLGEVDERVGEQYYDHVLTFGKGAYYAGSMVFSLFADRQGLKLGHRMMTLMPCGTPDDIFGAHQQSSNFEETAQGQAILGRQVYFVGEDLPLKANVPRSTINWLMHETLHCEKASRADLTLSRLEKSFRQFHVTQFDARTFLRHLKNLGLAQFQQVCGFDKRILPQFWYVFLSGTNENLAFFEAFGSFNPNDYEVSVFEAANRSSFLQHKKLRDALLQHMSTQKFVAVRTQALMALIHGRSSVKIGSVDLGPFFHTIHHYVKQHSQVWPYLNQHERVAYFEELLNVYPFSSLYKLSLAF